METIGSYLKECRMARHQSIHDVHLQTRISEKLLEEVEADKLDALGGYGYARATIYSIIRCLEADEPKSLRLLEQAYPKDSRTKFNPKKPIKENKVLISTNFLNALGIMVLIIILGIIVWKAYESYRNTPHTGTQIFHKTRLGTDTTNEKPKPAIVTKPDTVRMKMLQVKKTITAQSKPAKKATSVKSSAADTTDYVNDLIFKNSESPLNIRN